jgi:hypothetical protein
MKRLLAIIVITATLAGAAYLLLRLKPPAADLSSLPALLTMVPAESSGIVYLDLAALRSSDFGKLALSHLPRIREDAEYATFVQQTGFDYSRDLDRTILLWPSATHWAHSLIVAEGRFDPARIRNHSLQKGKATDAGGGVLRAGKTLSLFTANRAIIAESEGVEAPLQLTALAAGSTAPTPLPADWKERIAPLAAAPLFAVFKVEPASQLSPQVNRMLAGKWSDLPRSVRWLTLAARPEGDRLRVQLAAENDGLWGAMQMGLMLDGAKVLAISTLQNPQNRRNLAPEEAAALDGLLRSLTIARVGTQVQIKLEVTREVVRILLVAQERNRKSQSAAEAERK